MGVSHVTLAIGRKVTKVEEELNVVDPSDPFKLKTGGLLDLKSAKAAKALQNGEDDLSDVNRKHQDDQVGQSFFFPGCTKLKTLANCVPFPDRPLDFVILTMSLLPCKYPE